ncbi:MAG: hypothetical protein AAF125_07600, partial [Chloroflexota bacterium]
MRRLFIIVIGCLVAAVGASAQSSVLEPGDPPVASLITISRPDAANQVTITGATGAVFPAAQVAIRNLYTGQTVYTQAGITGQFSATLEGRGNTPFWVSPATALPLEVRTPTGSVPGGPGTIIYAPFPESEETRTSPITQLVLDGFRADWDGYPNTVIDGSIEGLLNLESAYLVLGAPPAQYAAMQVGLRLNGIPYAIQLNPRVNEAATWRETGEVPRDLGTIGVASAVADVVELRVPLEPLRRQTVSGQLDEVALIEVAYLDEDGNVLQTTPFDAPLNTVNEQNGIVYPDSTLDEEVVRFGIGGAVASGASSWQARVRLARMNLAPSDMLDIEIDVSLSAP